MQNKESTPKVSALSWLVLSHRAEVVTVQPFCGPETLMQLWGRALWVNSWPEALESLAQRMILWEKGQGAGSTASDSRKGAKFIVHCGVMWDLVRLREWPLVGKVDLDLSEKHKGLP